MEHDITTLEQLTTIGLTLLSAIVTGVVIPLIYTAGKKLNTILDAKAHSATFNCAMEKITTLTAGAVLEAQQTITKGFKKAAEDGRLTREEAAQIKSEVFAVVKESLGSKGYKELQQCLGLPAESVDKLINTNIEATYKLHKSQ